MKKTVFMLVFDFVIILTSCQNSLQFSQESTPTDFRVNSNLRTTPTPFQPELTSETPKASLHVPEFLRDLILTSDLNKIISLVDGDKSFQCAVIPGKGNYQVANITLIVVVPFKSVRDEISSEELSKLLFEDAKNKSVSTELFISHFGHQVLANLGKPLSNRVKTIDENELSDHLIENPDAIGIIPFEKLEPDWKVLKIDNISPLQKEFGRDAYFLNFNFSLACGQENDLAEKVYQELEYYSNRMENKLTVILMSGTTALTRATANRMELYGNTYPGEAIKPWFDQSDYRHVSSETPFFDSCPNPDPFQKDLSFCSQPEYLELFDYLGVNIIELTGNHLLDKGNAAFETTLNHFEDSGYQYYAGGFTEVDAKKPLLIDHNGNKIAFIGCNYAGPSNAWVTESTSGIASCNFDELISQISSLSQEGYLPIVTFQFYESNYMRPSAAQIDYFRRMIDSGAIIVSGSQSHVPMAMEVYKNGFIHYGLGNLFFDQMDFLDNRREFIDRHYFYDGKYINTELLTALLTDYAKPIPMTQQERENLLSDAFIEIQ